MSIAMSKAVTTP